jgi:hypothetical protein
VHLPRTPVRAQCIFVQQPLLLVRQLRLGSFGLFGLLGC